MAGWKSYLLRQLIEVASGKTGEEAKHIVLLDLDPLWVPWNSVVWHCCKRLCVICSATCMCLKCLSPVFPGHPLARCRGRPNKRRAQHQLSSMGLTEAFNQLTADSRAICKVWWDSAGLCAVNFCMSSLSVVFLPFLLWKTSATLFPVMQGCSKANACVLVTS